MKSNWPKKKYIRWWREERRTFQHPLYGINREIWIDVKWFGFYFQTIIKIFFNMSWMSQCNWGWYPTENMKDNRNRNKVLNRNWITFSSSSSSSWSYCRKTHTSTIITQKSSQETKQTNKQKNLKTDEFSSSYFMSTSFQSVFFSYETVIVYA